MIILLRCNDLNPDPRVDKYIQYFEQNKIEYKLVGWDRKCENLKKKNTIYFCEKSNYGDRRKNILKKIKWNLFLVKLLIKNRNSYNIIHACDFDTAFPSLIMKFFKKKIIFDVFDWIGDSNLSGIFIIDFLIKKLECFTANNCDQIIICDENRKKQMNIKEKNKKNIIVLPNIPSVKESTIKNIKLKKKNKEKLYISYVGVFDKSRNLKELLEVVKKNKNLMLDIAGFGIMEDLIKKYSNENNNIRFHGKVNYLRGLEIMKNSDLIYAMYSKKVSNHIFAAPNKYYEAMMLENPLITTKGTLIGNNVEKNKIGFVIEEDIYSLEIILNNKNIKEEIIVFKKNQKKLWEKDFKNYVEFFMKNDYSKILMKGKF